jgi:hypothetical protein
LYHQHWFQDFELDFTWKIAAGGNSAVVQLRVLEKISVEDQTLSAISNGESEIKLVNGKLQAVRIDGIVMIK